MRNLYEPVPRPIGRVKRLNNGKLLNERNKMVAKYWLNRSLFECDAIKEQANERVAQFVEAVVK